MQILRRLYRLPVTKPARPALRRFRRSRLMPTHWVKSWRVFDILNFQYGYLRSVATETPLDEHLDRFPGTRIPHSST